MDVSRRNIYSYIGKMLAGVSGNIYRIEAPKALSSNAVTNGFIIISMNDIIDHSEFCEETYAQVRINLNCYVPSTSTTKVMDAEKYNAMQTAIDAVITAECKKTNEIYNISQDNMLSADDFFSNETSSFFVYIKSFIITITN